MKKLTTILLLMVASVGYSFEATLVFTAIPSTAKIYYEGQMVGIGKAVIKVQRASLIEIKIVNEGYVTFERNYRYGKGSQFAKNQGLSGYERGNNSYTITLDVAPPLPITDKSESKTKEDRLIELKQLYDKQLITHEEYTETRKKIIIQ